MPRQPQKRTLRAARKAAFGFRGRSSARGIAFARGGRARRKIGVAWIVKTDLVVQLDPAIIIDAVSDWILAAHMEAIMRGAKADGSGQQPNPVAWNRRDRSQERARSGLRATSAGGQGGFSQRGYVTGHFAQTLQRSQIRISGPKRNATGILSGPTLAKSSRVRVSKLGIASGGKVYGTQAKTKIYADASRQRWLAREIKRGVGYFFVGGAIRAGIDQLVSWWVEGALEGGLREPNLSAIKSREAQHTR